MRLKELGVVTASRRTSPLSVGGHLVAAAGTGIMFSTLAAYAAMGPARLSLIGVGGDPGTQWLALTGTVMAALGAVLGTALPRYPFLARFGWLLAALVTLSLTYVDELGMTDVGLLMILAVLGGLILAAVLSSLAVAGRPGRAGIAIGLAVGVVLGAGWGLIASELAQLLSLPGHADEIMNRALAVTIALGGIVALLADRMAAAPKAAGTPADQPAAPPGPTPDAAGADRELPGAGEEPAPAVPGGAAAPHGGRRPSWWGPAVTVLLVTGAVAGLQLLAGSMVRALSVSSTGGSSPRRGEAVEALHEASHVAIGVLAGIVLLVAAYRRGGRDLARFVVVAFAAALPLAAGLPWNGMMRGQPVGFIVVLVAFGGAAGVALVLRLDRLAPWDAIGVAIAAVALVATSVRGRQEMPELADGLAALQAFAASAALGAGLCRLLQTRRGGVGDASAGRVRGLDGADAAGSAALGLAAFLVALQMYGARVGLAGSQYGDLQLSTSLTLAGAAVVLVVLFGLGRMVDSIRQDLVAEAAAPRVAAPQSQASPGPDQTPPSEALPGEARRTQG